MAGSRPSPPALPPEWAGLKNLLVMRLDNIGDVILSGPALRAVKETLPHTRVTLLASPAGAAAAPLLPWVDDVLVWRTVWQDLGRLSFDPARERALIQVLSDRRFDGAIIFTSFSQSPFPAGLACLLAHIPLRLGSSKEAAPSVLTTAAPALPDNVHEAERNLDVIEAVGFRVRSRHLSLVIDRGSRRRAEGLLSAAGVPPGEPYILLNPFATAQARTYPAGPFGDAASGLADKAALKVVVTGMRQETDRARAIVEHLGRHGADLSGMTTVGELAALVDGAALVMTNNTLTMHLADACGTPSVVLYSGTELESQWRPRLAPHRLLRKPTPCSPCYAFTCPTNLGCLDIPREEVVSAGLDLLSEWKGTEDREARAGRGLPS